MSERHFGPHSFETSNEDKVLFPDAGLTKGDLIDYYEEIAETMLPYVRNRPVSMKRYPDGLDGESFYQKEKPDHFPDWIESVTVEKEGGTVEHVVANNGATLAYLAQQACITPHVWLGTIEELDHPDRMIFDLDPPGDEGELFADLVEAARSLREGFEAMELPSFVMTSGSRGLHLWVPLDRSADFDTVRTFAEKVAEAWAGAEPERFTVAKRKEQRGDRIFLDYLRNSYGQTTAPPYAARARSYAPVATPLEWEELGPDLSPRDYTIRSIARRLAQKPDPWKGMARYAVSLQQWEDRLDVLKQWLEG
jgi:bifunctional non-homologous end joining protein LigD